MSAAAQAIWHSLVLHGAGWGQEDGEDDGQAEDADAGEAEEEVEGIPRQSCDSKGSHGLLGEESVHQGSNVLVASAGSHCPLWEHQRQAEREPDSKGHHAAAGRAGLNALALGHAGRPRNADLWAWDILLARHRWHEGLLQGGQRHQQQAAAHQLQSESHGHGGDRAGAAALLSRAVERTEDAEMRESKST